MASRSIAAGIVVLGLVSIAACEDDPEAPPRAGTSSSSSAAGGPSTSTPVTPSATNITEFCAKTLGVVLGAFERCCTAADKATLDYSFSQRLVALLEPQCRLVLAGSVGAGRVLYRADRAEACYAAYATTYGSGACTNITSTFADPSGTACREAYVGTGSDGAKCHADHECVDGLTCVGYTNTTDGLCRTPPALGEPCGAARVDGGSSTGETVLRFGEHPGCVSGAECDSLSGTCVTAKPKSEPIAEGGTCAANDDCAAGLYCDETRKCAARKTAGSACTGALLSSECVGRCDAATGQAGTCATFCGSR